MNQNKLVRIFWLVLIIIFLVSGAGFILLASFPFQTVKTFFDALAKDGSFDRLTLDLYRIIRYPSLILGVLCLAFGITLRLQRTKSLFFLQLLFRNVKFFVQRIMAGFRDLVQDIRSIRLANWEKIAFTIVFLLATLFRIILINRPMEYDESYTFSEFARHSLWQVVSDYHVPNNHVFHTILVHVSFLIFGGSPWAIRLPAFFAGLGMVVIVYFLGRNIYDPFVSIIAAAGVAAFPILILYSVNARGYTLICFLMLLLLILANYVKEHKNLAAWLLMAVISALGFYTIPIMLYPFGIVFTWLFFSGLVGDIHANYHGFFRWCLFLACTSACAALLSLILYFPIFQSNGILTVFNGNRVVNALSWPAFLSQFSLSIEMIPWEWTTGNLPVWVVPILLLGSLISLFLHPFHSPRHVSFPLQAATIIFLVPILFMQRPAILPRVWLFLLTLFIIWGSLGWVSLNRLISLAEPVYRWFVYSSIFLAVIGFLWLGGNFIFPYLKDPQIIRYPPGYDAEKVTQYFKNLLADGDVVVLSNDEDATYWYYFYYYQIPEENIRAIKSRPFKRAFIIMHPNSRYSIMSILVNFGPDPGFFRMDTLKVYSQIGNTIIYEVLPDQDVVDRAYGIK